MSAKPPPVPANNNNANSVLFLLIGMPLIMTVQAFTAVKIWAWHIVPHFETAPLSLATAFGIVCLWRALTIRTVVSRDDKPMDYISLFVVLSVSCLVVLLWAWLALKLGA